MLKKEAKNLVRREIAAAKMIQIELSHQVTEAADAFLQMKDCLERLIVKLDAIKTVLVAASTEQADAARIAKDIAELGSVKFWDCEKHDGRLRPR